MSEWVDGWVDKRVNARKGGRMGLTEEWLYGTSLAIQWLRLHAPNSGSLDSIPCQGTRSPMPQLKILYAKTKTRYDQVNHKINIKK